MDINIKIKLNNDIDIPIFGFGTWELKGKEVKIPLFYALKKGYRLIDTASKYENENEIGEIIKKSGISREKLFIVTKLRYNELDVLKGYNESIKKLGVDYIDLFLVHVPVKDKETRKNIWRQMESLYKKGNCKAIGVSNYNIEQVKELLDYAKIVPAVNQIKFNPYCNQKELKEFCEDKKIKIMGYSPLRGGQLKDGCVIQLAKKYSKTPAQVILRWSLQKGVITIPRSSNKKRIKENSEIFDFMIEKEDVKFIDSLNKIHSFNIVYIPTENNPFACKIEYIVR